MSDQTICNGCHSKIDNSYMFCPRCGIKRISEIKHNSLTEILATEILVASMIYEETDIKDQSIELTELKTREDLIDFCNKTPLVDLNKTRFLSDNILSLINCSSGHHFSDAIINPNMTNMNRSIQISPYSHSSVKCVNPILNSLNVKHVAFGTDCGVNNMYKKFSDVLIQLIENKILNPKCGYGNLQFILNYNLSEIYDKYVHGTHKDKSIKELSLTLQINATNENYYLHDNLIKIKNTKFHDQLSLPQNIQNLEYQATQSFKHYKETQKQFDDQLNQIKYDIYYSQLTKTFYTEHMLLDNIKYFSNIYDITLKNHCTHHKIKHVNIYILNSELEDMIYVANIHNKINKIHTKFSKKEGIDETFDLFE